MNIENHDDSDFDIINLEGRKTNIIKINKSDVTIANLEEDDVIIDDND